MSQVHSEASTDTLLAGLDFLSRSIEKKSASLKVLVESNFERFVGAKATIDRVYNEMRDQGKAPDLPKPTQHIRTGSRSSFTGRERGPSFTGRERGPSFSLAPGVAPPVPTERKKNALVKESEYGVSGIKVPLTEVAVKAEEVWGPALNGREREETLKSILESVEQHRGLFEVASAMQDAIRHKDHEAISEEYKRARKYVEEARHIVEQNHSLRAPLSDDQIHQIIVTARMWSDVERQVARFKRDTWKRLGNAHFVNQRTGGDEVKSDQYLSIISIMLELGADENPIWHWLSCRFEYLKSRLNITCERSRVELEILRRHIANGDKSSLRMLQKHLRSVPTSSSVSVEPSKLDTQKVIEFWEHINVSMTALLSNKNGLLAEMIEYWDIVQSFVSGRAQRDLPKGYQNQSAAHHALSEENRIELERGLTELISIIRDHLYSFFSDPPIEDVSMLFSPLPTSASPTTPRTPLSAALTPTSGSRFRFDMSNMPPPSPSRGDTWEKYAFWPPNSNALSGSYYLSKTMVLISTAANELASLRLPETGLSSRFDELLRLLLGNVRERCVQAVCAAWNTDAEKMKVLEDWTRNADRKDTTNLPQRFMAVQSFLLNNLQRILYVEASTKTRVDVVIPPSNKLLQLVRSQFVTSLYRTFTGMVECADQGRKALGNDFEVKGDDLTIDELEIEEGSDDWTRVDANKQVRFPPCTQQKPVTNLFPVHSPSPHPVQHVRLPVFHRSATRLALRNSLLCATDRRNCAYPRCPDPTRRTTLQILHQATRRENSLNYRTRHLQPVLGTPSAPQPRRRRPRTQPLRLHRASRPRHRAHGSKHHVGAPNAAHSPRPLRRNNVLAHQYLSVHRTPDRFPRAAHAGHAGRGVFGPDARGVYYGAGVADADGHLSGFGCED